MVKSGCKPDAITFSCLLTACSHTSLVDKASQVLEDMPRKYGVQVDAQHWTAWVDTLARAGQHQRAEKALLSSEHFQPPPLAAIMTTLAAAVSQGDVASASRLHGMMQDTIVQYSRSAQLQQKAGLNADSLDTYRASANALMAKLSKGR
jgi:pentatricopeptide repeat protein